MLRRKRAGIAYLVLTWLSAFVLALPAQAQSNGTEGRNVAVAGNTKVALVIGNSRYKTQPLANPGNDARAIAAKLKGLGFDVILRENLGAMQIGGALREFRTKLKAGSVGLFFYAGHGLQVKGVNYLPAVDAEIASEEDVPRASLNVNEVLGLMDEAKTRLNLVFLDACRDNPYARRFRSSAGGLAKLEAPSGTLISFATRPGSVASDAGSGNNGLYTEHLLAAMNQPGLAIEQVLKRVVSGVKRASGGAQEPWMEGSIEGEFYFHGSQAGAGGTQVATIQPAPMPAVRLQSADEIEQELWNGIKDSRDSRDFDGYLSSYPNGRFVALARQKQRSLIPASTPATAATAAPALAPRPTMPPQAAPASAGLHDIQVKAPDIAENGAVVPVEIAFNPPLQPGEGAELRVNGALASALVVHEGGVSAWSLRLVLPASGTVQVQAGGSTAEKFVKVSVGGSPDSLASRPLFNPAPGLYKLRTTSGDVKALLNGTLNAGRLKFSGSGFQVSVSGSPYLSMNPLIGFKGSVLDGDNIQLSMAQ